ncbi:hypothetical protein D3C72_1499320 [compost metagenome]
MGEKVFVSVARDPEKIFMDDAPRKKRDWGRGHLGARVGVSPRQAPGLAVSCNQAAPSQAWTSISTSTSMASLASTVERDGKSVAKWLR